MLFIGSVGVFILVFFVMQKKYTATVTILPPSQNMSMGLSGQMSA
jgi:LPS O-antigen subunit length determinant protein (WzzB/FepE family)